MYAGVSRPPWLPAAAAGSARFRLSFSPSSSSVSSFYAWVRRSGRAAEVAKILGLKNPSQQQGICCGGRRIVNGDGIWTPGLLRSFSSLSIRAPRVMASAAALTTADGINTGESVEGTLKDFIFDGSRATAIAHKVWQGVVRPGDTVIDATCGNGLDTLVLAKLVLQDGTAGYVIGLDLQQSALDNTSVLLDRELNSSQRDKVSLLQLCHSQLDKVVDDSSVRLVAFNLGYQPGGNKSVTTQADTTVKALGAAVNVLEQQGLISIMSYVGHPGGREEHDAAREFVAGLPPQDWVCSHLEWVNIPRCPHLMFVLRK